MAARSSDYFEGLGTDLLKSGQFKNVQELAKAFALGLVEAKDPDQGFPIIPINHLKKIGPRYSKLNTIIIIAEKYSLHTLRLSPDEKYDSLSQEYISGLRSIPVNINTIKFDYYQALQIKLPDIFFDYHQLIKAGITLNTEFNFIWFCVPYKGEDGAIKQKLDNCKHVNIKLRPMEMTSASIKWEFIAEDRQNYWKYYDAFDAAVFYDISVCHNAPSDYMQIEQNQKAVLKKQRLHNYHALPQIVRVPSWELKAILHTTSRIKLSDIEAFFIFGEGDIGDNLLKSLDEYFTLTGNKRQTVNTEIIEILSEKAPRTLERLFDDWANSYHSGWDNIQTDEFAKQWASALNLRHVALRHELLSYLSISSVTKLNFIHKYMLEASGYEWNEGNDSDIFLPLDCDLNSYTKKYFFPITEESKQKAERDFESAMKSLFYKKISVAGMRKPEDYKPLTVGDLAEHTNLAELRTYCQSLLRVYSKEELYYELREKKCKQATAAKLLYRTAQESKPSKQDVTDDPYFGYPKGTVDSEGSRLEALYNEISKPYTANRIAILAHPGLP